MKLSLKFTTLLAPVFALIVAFGLSTVMLYLIGEDPIETFKIMYDYGKTGKSIVSILNRSVPLYISAVAVAVGFKMGLFNICLLYTSPSPRDATLSRMPSSA